MPTRDRSDARYNEVAVRRECARTESCTLGAICCEAAKRRESRGLAYTRNSKAQPIRVAYRQLLPQRLPSEMRVQGPSVEGITQRADSALVRWFFVA